MLKVKVAQSCPTVCGPMGYTVHKNLQGGILEWVAVPSPGDLLNPVIKHRSPTLQVDSLPGEPGKVLVNMMRKNKYDMRKKQVVYKVLKGGSIDWYLFSMAILLTPHLF